MRSVFSSGTGSPRAGLVVACVALIALCGFAAADQKGPQATAKEHAAPATTSVEFNRDIRPILSAKCFACHGSDPKSLQAGLRLDRRDDATRKLPTGDVAIVPGKPQSSALIRRIFATTDDMRMPPVGSNRTLSAEDKQTLKRWIEQGAEYKPHWAFVKPVRPPLPAVHLKSWPRNGIDNFILARLEKEGLKPSPYADRATLIRRVSLDLTGIPPTPKEVDAFLADRSPNAYEKVVDRLLASPQYGERMALGWLDGARYADSNGYQSDWERFQWRWRDWVIDAFNKNMPFDRFTIEQIAGDMLPNATLDQKIATGFNRNHRINTEGGIIPEEWRVETVIDRVETTSAVWLGLTMGCGRCHDHKYDPISQKEFYKFCAYFNNVPESGINQEAPVNTPPYIKAPTPEQQTRLAQLDETLKGQNARVNERLAANGSEAANWKLADLKVDDRSLQNGLLARYALSDHPVVAAGAAPTPTTVGKLATDPGRKTGAVVIANNSYVDLGSVGDFDRKDAFSYGAWINPTDGNGAIVAKMDTPPDFRGWDLLVSGGRPMVHLVNRWPSNALKIISKMTIPNGQWTHLLLTYDGSAKPEGVKLYINGKATEFDVEVNALTDTLHTTVSTKIGTRTGSNPFTGKIEDVVLYHRVLSPEEAVMLADADPAKPLLAIAPEKRTEEQKQEIVRLWSERNDPEYRQRVAARDATMKERTDLDAQVSTVMVMEEMPKPRDCFVLTRGQYDHPADKVTAGLPAAFPPLPPGAPNNRLGLAEWIASPDNPLTARVFVNRMWAKFFGIGIVSTIEDFGTRAEFPSHPELLDWLATEFVRLKWNMKAIQKEMVMSATYCQASKVTPDLVRRDPDNRLLARGPRFRLSAELIRDQALAISGLLVEKIGGPSVRPYQPTGIWDDISVYGNLHNYMHDKGPNLYRRSLYTIWKRTSAPPLMTLFDAPSREVCTVRRSRTDTPLQALALMNEDTFVEASRVLAQRMLSEGGPTPQSRIAYAFRRAICRPPTAAETRILTAGIERRLAAYRANPDAAMKLVSIGDAPRDPKLNAAELASYTMTASIILNMDETITKE